MLTRVWLHACAAVAVCAPALAAQRDWHSNLYPYVYYSTSDGVWGAARYALTSPLGFAERPEPNAAAFTLDASASTQGSYAVVADASAPALWAGWRVALTLGAARENRLGFYGLGNDTPYTPGSVTPAAPYFYRVSRTHAAARAIIQRRVIGPLRLLAGAAIERTDFRALPGASVFRQDLATGVVDSSTIPFTDKTVRAGVVLDTRDNELDPHAGVFLEGIVASGPGYTRTTAAARVYVHPIEHLTLAARVAGEGMGGTPPLATQLSMESSERAFLALGGYYSLRGFYDARFVGPHKLLGGVEARYAVLRAPSLFELMVVGFCDAGRVFASGERFRLTSTGLHTSGGGELAARVLRNSLVAVGVGAGDEGVRLLFGTRWSY
ncbi:MAG: hypothetical protein DMD28_05960 [Gemmatimonadetes bacterium]|nr:MAG: hypothetical protein DMD28_05960 [Gemmatimonadota bacterium]